MPLHSPALETFDRRVIEVELILSFCQEDVALKTQSEFQNKNDALCRAALVLLCGHMEGFFEDLVENILKFHEFNQTIVERLPLRLRILQLWRHIDGLEPATDDKKWSAIQRIREASVADSTTKCEVGSLNFDLHVKGFSTPGSTEVARLFHSVGLDNVWQLIEMHDSSIRILKDSLDALVNRRHPIAHGDAAAKATPGDVRQYISDMRKLTEHIDRTVTAHLSPHCENINPWDIVIGV